jgi:uncharacterized membrane protein YphA (DoxX/SURF4 family)
MKWRKGPRPWPVNAFGTILVCYGLWGLCTGLLDLSSVELPSQVGAPGSKLDQDAKIIFLSANFTIILIPVVAVWGLASRIARMIVTFFTLPSWAIVFVEMWALLSPDPFNLGDFAKHFSIVVAVLLLFTPAAKPWFREETVLVPPAWD